MIVVERQRYGRRNKTEINHPADQAPRLTIE